MEWSDRFRMLRVRTNADTPHDANRAREFGAEGIGLCRTEHMFFDHLDEIREMIFATKQEDREQALARLLPFQRDDFTHLFKTMGERPVTIRLLDPPLHEFLALDNKQITELSRKINVSPAAIRARILNPLDEARGAARSTAAAETAATRVEFFTMVRGE